jgi:DedD protein
MGWFSNVFSNAFSAFGRAASDASASSAPAADADTVQEARIRSRRRLIGAVVLVVIGVIGFPLVFETQPRPIPVDIPIEIPRKEGVPPLAMPSPKVAAPAASAPTIAPSAPVAATPAKPAAVQAVEEVIAPGRPPAAVSSLPVLTPAAPVKAAEKPASAPVKTAAKPLAPAEGDRAKALLEGSSSAKVEGPKEAGRFVVQVGAFAENDAARTTRLKVEKLGLKTYVQVAETPAGKRIRVRVGPYATKDEAEQAKTKLTAGGLPAVLLTL